MDSVDISAGHTRTLKPLAGRRYRIMERKLIGGDKITEDISEVVAVRENGQHDADLVLLLGRDTRIVFDKFYEVCDDNLCGVELPSHSGGWMVLGASSQGHAIGSGDARIVYSMGAAAEVAELVDSYAGNFKPAHDAVAKIADHAGQGASSAMSSLMAHGPALPLGLLAAAGGLVAVAAGGGSGGGHSSAPTPTPTPVDQTVTVHGSIVAGPVLDANGLVVTLYKPDGTVLAGPVAVSADGTFVMSYSGAYAGPVLARVADRDSGVDYADEATGGQKDLVGDLRAIFVSKAGVLTINISVNPITELAVRELGLASGDGGTSSVAAPGLTEVQVNAANQKAAQAFGLSGDATQAAIAVINKDGSANANANAAGIALAVLSGLDRLYSEGGYLDQMASALASGDQDKILALRIAGAREADLSGALLARVATSDAVTSAALTTAGQLETTLSQKTSTEITQLSLATVSALSVQAVGSLGAEQAAALTPAQIKVLSPSALVALNTSRFSSAQLSAMSSLQLKATYSQGQTSYAGMPQDGISIVAIPIIGGEFKSKIAAGVIVKVFDGETEIGEATIAPDGTSWSYTPTVSLLDGQHSLTVKVVMPDRTSYVIGQPLVFTVKALSNVQQAEISKLPLDQFAALQPADIGTLTADQVRGLSAVQVATLTAASIVAMLPSALAAMPVNTIASLSPSSIGALLAEQLQALTLDQVASLTGGQMGAITGVNITQLTAAQMERLTPSAVGGISAAAIASLTDQQIDSLSTAQVAAFTAAQASHFTSNHIQGLSNVQVGALSPAAVAALSTTQLDNLSADQVAHIAPAAIAQMTPAQVASLSALQVAALTNGQAAVLTGSQIEALSADQVASLTGLALATLTPGQLDHLSAEQVAAILPTAFGSLTASQFTSLSPVQVQALTPAVVAVLTNDQVAGFTPDQVAVMTPTQVAAFSTAIVEALSADQVSHLSAQSIAILSDAQIDHLSATQVSALTATQVEGFTAGQIQGLSNVQVGALSPVAVAALSTTQLDNLSADQVSHIAPAAVAQMTPVQVASLSALQVAALTSGQAAVLTGSQIEALSADQVASLTGPALATLTPGQLDHLSAEQVAAILPTAFSSLTAAQLTSLSPVQVQALTPGVVAVLTNDQVAGFTPDQVAVMTPTQVAAFSTAIVEALSADQVSHLSAQSIAILSDAQIDHLSATQVSALTATQVEGFTAGQIQGLSNVQVGALSPVAVAALSTTQLDNLSADQVSHIAPAAVAQMTPAQVSSLTTDQLASLTEPQYASVTPSQVAALSGDQIAAIPMMAIDNLSPQAVAAIRPELVDELSTQAIAAFTGPQVQALTLNQLEAMSDAQIAAFTPIQTASMSAGQIDAIISVSPQISVTDNEGSSTGPILSGGSTDDQSPLLSGTFDGVLASGMSLVVYNGQQRLGEATVSGMTWSYASQTLGEGTKTFSVRAEVAGGAMGASAGAFSLKIDTSAPVVETVYTINENTGLDPILRTVALQATDATGPVSYTNLSGTDAASFTLDGSSLKFANSANFETKSAYSVTLDATDAVGNPISRTITINIADVNERPTAVGTVPDQIAVKDQSVWSLDLSSYFADVDHNETRHYQLQAGTLPSGLTINAGNGIISGTPDATMSSGQYTVVMTDHGGLTVSQTFNLAVVAAPVVQSFTVTDATGSPSAGKGGDALTFRLVFSEAVTSTDTNAISLDFTVGGRTVTASYASGNGTNEIVLTGTAPISGDGTNVSIDAMRGSFTGAVSHQAWITSSTATATYNLDNTAPAITTGSFTAAENGTAVGTVLSSDTDGVTWSISGSGTDDTFFSITAGGLLTFKQAQNFELPGDADHHGDYVVRVRATDGVGNVADRDVIVNLTNVNEGPTATGTIQPQTAVTNSSGWSLATSNFFSDVDDGDTGHYAITTGTLPAGLHLDVDTGVITGTPASASASTSYTVTRTDSGGLTASQSFNLTVVSAPVVQSFTVIDADGDLGIGRGGDQLTFTVTFSEAMSRGSGYPTMSFKIGGAVVEATYDSGAEQGSESNEVIFTVSAPVSGNGTDVSIDGFSGDLTGMISHQSWVTNSSQTAHYTLDNTLPGITTTSLSAAENGTAVGQVVGSDTNGVTWSIDGSGADDSFFSISAGGVLSLNQAQDFEQPGDFNNDGTYAVAVKATDGAGNTHTQTISVHLTNVNETPFVASDIADQSAVIGQAFDFTVPAGTFEDPDAGTSFSYSATLGDGTALPGWLTFDSATHRFHATSVGGASGTIAIKVTASDGALSTSDTFDISVLAAPTLAASFADISNFDVRSKLVLTLDQDVVFNSAGTIIIRDIGGSGTAGAGYQGENSDHTQTINLSGSHDGVTIEHVGGKTLLVIDPDFDLDLSSNYRLEVSAGSLLGQQTNIGNVAYSVNFGTVTPGVWNQGSSGVLAQQVDETTGSLIATQKWLDMTDPAADNPGAQVYETFDASTGAYAFVISDVDPATDNWMIKDSYIKLNKFGLNDTFYIDDKFNIPGISAFFNDTIFGSGGAGTVAEPFFGGFQGQTLRADVALVFEDSLIQNFDNNYTVDSLLSFIPTIGTMWVMA